MGASPAEVANDLWAQGTYFQRRDDDVSKLCFDAAHLIRDFLAVKPIDGRRFYGVMSRIVSCLVDRPMRYSADSQIAKSLARARVTLDALRASGGALR